MKKIGILCIIVGFFIVFAPILSMVRADSSSRQEEQTTSTMQGSENEAEMGSSDPDDFFLVYIKDKDEVINLSALEYITGVVAAEMPALYNEEALKAQAVTSYTYAHYIRLRSQKSPDASIKNAHISDQSTAHQAY